MMQPSAHSLSRHSRVNFLLDFLVHEVVLLMLLRNLSVHFRSALVEQVCNVAFLARTQLQHFVIFKVHQLVTNFSPLIAGSHIRDQLMFVSVCVQPNLRN